MKTQFEIKKNEWGLFELHITDEFGEGITLIKKTKKEITDFLRKEHKVAPIIKAIFSLGKKKK